MNKNAIISFANSKGNYINGLARLGESLRNNSEGIDFISFIGEASLGCELHINNPYSFKIAAFKKAKEAGYKNILWLDSSCFAIKSVQSIFDEIENTGFIFQDAGYYISEWTNEDTLKYYGLTKESSSLMKMIGNAGFLGLNFNMHKPNEFFNKWEESMLKGYFKGDWKDHRHDMSNSSILVHLLNIDHLMKKGDEWLQYAGLYQETANEKIIIKAQGI